MYEFYLNDACNTQGQVVFWARLGQSEGIVRGSSSVRAVIADCFGSLKSVYYVTFTET